jgi:hypothetical protein
MEDLYGDKVDRLQTSLERWIEEDIVAGRGVIVSLFLVFQLALFEGLEKCIVSIVIFFSVT